LCLINPTSSASSSPYQGRILIKNGKFLPDKGGCSVKRSETRWVCAKKHNAWLDLLFLLISITDYIKYSLKCPYSILIFWKNVGTKG